MEQLEKELQEEHALDVDPMTEITDQQEMWDKTVAPEELPKVLDDEPLGTPNPLGPKMEKPLFTPKQMEGFEGDGFAPVWRTSGSSGLGAGGGTTKT